MSKTPVFGSPFEETISVPQLQWVKGETLVVMGVGIVGLHFFSFYHTCLSIGEATLERL